MGLFSRHRSIEIFLWPAKLATHRDPHVIQPLAVTFHLTSPAPLLRRHKGRGHVSLARGHLLWIRAAWDCVTREAKNSIPSDKECLFEQVVFFVCRYTKLPRSLNSFVLRQRHTVEFLWNNFYLWQQLHNKRGTIILPKHYRQFGSRKYALYKWYVTSLRLQNYESSMMKGFSFQKNN